MKLYLFAAFVSISYVANSQGVYMDPDSISFSDFRGKVIRYRNHLAETHCGMVVSIDTTNGVANYRVYPTFFKDSSWIDFKDVPEEKWMDLFLHEQLNYCIAILVAKELKSYFLEHPPETFDEWRKACNEYAFRDYVMGFKYEHDTYWGDDKEKQSEWRALVNRQLDSLKNISLDLPK
jgi:hypothetical protein